MCADLLAKTLPSSPSSALASLLSPISNQSRALSPLSSGLKKVRNLLDALSPLKTISDGLNQAQKMSELYPDLIAFTNSLSPVKDATDALLQVKSVADRICSKGIEQPTLRFNSSEELPKILEEDANVAVSKGPIIIGETLDQGTLKDSKGNHYKVSPIPSPIKENKYIPGDNSVSPKPGTSNMKNKLYEVSMSVIKETIQAKTDNCSWRSALLLALSSTLNKKLTSQVNSESYETLRFSQQQLNGSPSAQSSKLTPIKKPSNSECVVCSKELSIESPISLPCGHSLHRNCLYCCYLYFEMENLGDLTCPIQECRKVVPKDIIELIKELDYEIV